MKYGYRPLFFASLCCCIIVLVHGALDSFAKPMSLEDEYLLSKQDIDSLEQKALYGDGIAAQRLYRYYMFNQDDYAKGRYWLQIGAENGDINSEINYVVFLRSNLPPRSNKSRSEDKLRMCYWIQRILASGVSEEPMFEKDAAACTNNKNPNR